MEQKIYTLPEYPQSVDMWQELKREVRPIVVYGMGNGADKLFERLSQFNITPAAVFASDGFVRGHSYRGYKVRSFSEIKEEYSDFVILLSFATRRADVLEMLLEIDKNYDMYIPDMPVADTSEYFDKDFYNANYSDILKAYNSLSDSESKNVFASVIRFKLTGKMHYLENCSTDADGLNRMLPCEKIKSYIDVGAYTGDTLGQALKNMPNLSSATLIEPDAKTFKRLKKYTDTLTGKKFTLLNAAALDKVGTCQFSSSGNRNSTAFATASYESYGTEIPSVTIDSLGLTPDYIKFDVEGGELEALLGTHETVERCKPALLVSLYHRSRDIFFLINYLQEKYPFYTFRLCKIRCVPAWEIDLILTLS